VTCHLYGNSGSFHPVLVFLWVGSELSSVEIHKLPLLCIFCPLGVIDVGASAVTTYAAPSSPLLAVLLTLRAART